MTKRKTQQTRLLTLAIVGCSWLPGLAGPKSKRLMEAFASHLENHQIHPAYGIRVMPTTALLAFTNSQSYTDQARKRSQAAPAEPKQPDMNVLKNILRRIYAAECDQECDCFICRIPGDLFHDNVDDSAFVEAELYPHLSPVWPENGVATCLLMCIFETEGSKTGCHACGPAIGSALLSLKGGEWQAGVTKKFFNPGYAMGAWGDIMPWHFVQVSKRRWGVLFHDWDGNQGYYSELYCLLFPIAGSICLQDFDGGVDNTGALENTKYTASFNFVKSDAEYYDIHLSFRGIRKGQPVKKEEKFRLVKSRYERIGKPELHKN